MRSDEGQASPLGIVVGVATNVAVGLLGTAALVVIAFAHVDSFGGPSDAELQAWQPPAFLLVLAAMAALPVTVFKVVGRTTWARALACTALVYLVAVVAGMAVAAS